MENFADRIVGLQNMDIIDLKKIDADVTSNGNQKFALVSEFTNHAGQLVVSYDGEGTTTVMGDIDGDGVADLVIYLDGDHHDFTNFVL